MPPAPPLRFVPLLALCMALAGCARVHHPGASSSAPPRARPLFHQPGNWIAIPPGPGDRAAEINQALARVRDSGGGTVFLPAGTYRVASTLLIQTEVDPDGTQRNPFHVRLLGAAPARALPTPGAPADDGTHLIWDGPPDRTVIEVTHAVNTTLQNLHLSAGPGRRFRYGVFFHRTQPASGRLVTPTALTLLDSSIGPGQGAFTTGIRIGDVGPDGALDQNLENNYLENLYIHGATDDDGGTPDDPRDGLNSAGIVIDGTQVQASLLRNLHIDRCGTGVFVLRGQLQIFGGLFTNNVQPGPGRGQSLADDNHSSAGDPAGRGGGDFVLRSLYYAGHVIQDVRSRGSYRFLTSFVEDPGSSPHTGRAADWQSDETAALAVVHCDLARSLHPRGESIFLRGSGGPLAIVDTSLGAADDPPQRVLAGTWTQASVAILRSRFNHAQPPFFQTDAKPDPGRGAPPHAALLQNQGLTPAGWVALPDSGVTPAQAALWRRLGDGPLWATPRRLDERPPPGSGYVLDLTRPFEYRGQRFTARAGAADWAFDSAPVLQAALDKLADESPAGGTIWLGNGRYVLRRTLELRGLRGVQILGVGGKSPTRVLGDHLPVKGTALAWDGPETPGQTLLSVRDSQDITLAGIYFTTLAGPGQKGGARTVDTAVHVSGATTRDVWLQDTGVGWLSGETQALDQGVCQTFLRIGDGDPERGPRRVTLLSSTVSRAADQGVLIDGGARDVQLLLYTATASRRAVRTTSAGGEFAWLGGGAGNTLSSFQTLKSAFTDPVMVELQGLTGPVFLSGRELQDTAPCRALRASGAAQGGGRVVVYGDDSLFYAPQDGRLIDFRLSGGELFIYGSGLGTLQFSGDPRWAFARRAPRLFSAGRARVYSLANAFETRGLARPFQAAGGHILDLGSRARDKDPAARWPAYLQSWAPSVTDSTAAGAADFADDAPGKQ